MSYRMYIASHSKQSDFEKTNIFQNVILPTMQTYEEYKDFFLNAKFLKSFGCQTQLELGTEPVIQTILPECPSYIPKTVLDAYKDYLPQSPNDSGYIGLLTPNLLQKYLKRLHEFQLEQLQKTYHTCKTDKAYAAEYAVSQLADKITTWKTSLEHFHTKQIPYCVETSHAYFLYQVYDLYQRTDFTTTDLILYGW